MEKEKLWTDEMHNACGVIRNQAYELDGIGDAFYLIGNDVMAKTLRNMAESLLTQQDEILHSIGKYLHDLVNNSNKTLGELIEAIINPKEEQ